MFNISLQRKASPSAELGRWVAPPRSDLSLLLHELTMVQLDFFFPKANLTAAAVKLEAVKGSPMHGKPIAAVEAQLIATAVQLFETRFKGYALVDGPLVNEGVLQVPVIWAGFGAIFSAGDSVSGSSVVSHSATVNVSVKGSFVVSVGFWSYLD